MIIFHLEDHPGSSEETHLKVTLRTTRRKRPQPSRCKMAGPDLGGVCSVDGTKWMDLEVDSSELVPPGREDEG